MTAGDPVTWCNVCGGFFPVGMAHACMPRYGSMPTYGNPPPPNTFTGCVPLVQLTEADVRRIVREELERSKAGQ